MGEQNWMELLNRQTWLKQVQATNQYTEKFGLALSEKDAELLLVEKNNTLKAERRVEFGQSILPHSVILLLYHRIIMLRH